MLDDQDFFTVTDLKQFTYCPRVVFYERYLPHIRPRTFKMDAGRDEHELEQKRASRRTLTRLGVIEGSREFDVTVEDSILRLRGQIDEVITTAEGELIPIDYKLTRQVRLNHKLQLTAYGMLIEGIVIQAVNRGFIYLIPLRRMVEVRLTDALRAEVLDLLQQMTNVITHETMPEKAPNRNSCIACEFRRFCNDV